MIRGLFYLLVSVLLCQCKINAIISDNISYKIPFELNMEKRLIEIFLGKALNYDSQNDFKNGYKTKSC